MLAVHMTPAHGAIAGEDETVATAPTTAAASRTAKVFQVRARSFGNPPGDGGASNDIDG
jgi:hypothetical protein